MRTFGRVAGSVAFAVTASLALGACSGLQFVQDRRLTFTSPAANQLTKTPVTLSWSMAGYPTGPGQGEYAVFVDKAPLKVGKTLQSLVDPKVAPTAKVLNAKNIYTTTEQTITLTQVPDLSYDTEQRQRHSVTVVLLDAAGKRTTESAWTRYFDLIKLNNGATS